MVDFWVMETLLQHRVDLFPQQLYGYKSHKSILRGGGRIWSIMEQGTLAEQLLLMTTKHALWAMLQPVLPLGLCAYALNDLGCTRFLPLWTALPFPEA